MFAEHYGFSGPPFALTPDARFFFGSRGHSRAIAHLVYGLSQSEGFIVITGEVGAGKTTLVEQLSAQLDRANYLVGRIVTTRVGGDDLLQLALSAFGERETQPGKAGLLRRFEELLREQRGIGRRVLLIVDEVQNLSFAALEELRMLSNITVTDPRTGSRIAVQTILLGQPQFRKMLSAPDLDQLRQRVLASFHLGPLDAEETRAYVEHRLRMVGWNGTRPAFEPAAYEEVFRQTGGIPRRINTLCSRVLLLGALEETDAITQAMVEQTAAEQAHDLGSGGKAAARAEYLPGVSSVEAAVPGTRAGPVADQNNAEIPGVGAPGFGVAGFGASGSDGPDGAAFDALSMRVQRLEATVLRQDRVTRGLLDLMAAMRQRGPAGTADEATTAQNGGTSVPSHSDLGHSDASQAGVIQAGVIQGDVVQGDVVQAASGQAASIPAAAPVQVAAVESAALPAVPPLAVPPLATPPLAEPPLTEPSETEPDDPSPMLQDAYRPPRVRWS